VEQLADGVFRLGGFPPDAINVYVLEDVLLDAGTVMARRRILRQTAGWGIAAHALTHAHPDHFGSSHAVCEALGVPLWCPAGDVATVERGVGAPAASPLGRLAARAPLPPLHPVGRSLREGDEVGGFRVLETPGHSPGHCSYWRASDRVLVVGDVIFGTSLLGRPGLREPPRAVTTDPARNRASTRRLADLEPRLALFGHGPPLRDPGRLQAFAAALGRPAGE
jgi:hydroxyacylglutathione hydrolase